MYNLPEQFASAKKASVEAFETIAKTAFASTERMAALNLNAARILLEDSVDNARALFAIKDVQGLALLQTTLGQPDVHKASAYSRRVYDIATQTQEALSQAVNARFSEINKNLGQLLDDAVKTAPPGSDVAVKAIRSALSAANSAYDSMTIAAKQVTKITESNLAAATTAAIKASKRAA